MASTSSAAASQAEPLSQKIFDEMVNDLIYNLSCEELRLALERKLPCPHCGRKCRDLFYGQYVIPCSRQPSQQTMPLSQMQGSASDNIVQIQCLQCQRSIASTRYAQHLSECMGLTGRKRRAPMSRTATISSTNISPYLTGESSDDDDEAGSKKRRLNKPFAEKSKNSNLKKETSAYSPSPLAAQSPATHRSDHNHSTNGNSAAPSSASQLGSTNGSRNKPAIVISDSSSDTS